MQDDRRFYAHSDSDFEPENEAFPEDTEDNFERTKKRKRFPYSLSSDDDDSKMRRKTSAQP